MESVGILGVIPARLGSTRLARKVLREIAGRPMVEWVWRAAVGSGQMDEVVVATDSDEVAEVCAARGIPVAMTSPECQSGSDRVYEVSRQVEAEIYVNIQGDEPLLTPGHFRPMLELFARPEVEVTTVSVPCPAEDVANPNAVKVVTAADGRALYFSRSTIPYDRDNVGFAGYRKHLGLYAYRKAALERFAGLTPSRLELTERLEQLRMLENGMDIYVGEAEGDSIGVDVEEDLRKVEGILMGGARESFARAGNDKSGSFAALRMTRLDLLCFAVTSVKGRDAQDGETRLVMFRRDFRCRSRRSG
jgi:3-deoxy-manno-octulosonate cytidylyltransferase (CMP-KDO synthetase)